MDKSNQQLIILLVEDNPGDVRLVKEALKEVTASSQLFVVHNGVDALAFLKKEGEYTAMPRPHLVLLDWNLPVMGGEEVLSVCKQEKRLLTIPVIVMTTSAAERDILAAYNLHANSYLVKPIDFDEFVKLVKTIHAFWEQAAFLADPII